MVTPINLRRHRKRKARHDREQEAAANRARFGRTKAERAADAQAAERSEHHLDGHLLDRGAKPSATDDDERHR